MRKALEEFFAAHFPLSGLAASAVRLPDGKMMHQCFDRWLQPAQVRQAIAHLAQARDSFRQYQLHADRVVWVFEHLRVYLCVRPDEICLALFLQNRPDLPIGLVETVLREFAECRIP
jgi:hypothetical protein